MRRTVLAAAFLLLSTGGCRSSVDLSTAKGQLRFGVQAARMELWREAQFRFLRAVEMNPDDPMAYNNLAVAYEGIGEFESAREAYLRALRIDRSNQYIQRNYSRFVEFYSRKEARDEKIEDAGGEDGESSEPAVSPDPDPAPESEESDEGDEARPDDDQGDLGDQDAAAVPESRDSGDQEDGSDDGSGQNQESEL